MVTRDEQGRYELTEWGKGLATPVREFVRWAAPLMNGEAKWRFLSEPLAGDSVGLNVRRIRSEPT